MRIAIVDDEAAEQKTLLDYLAQYQKEVGCTFELSAFRSGDELLSQYQNTYELLLLDIEMPGTNGLDTARRIRAQDTNVTILFITNMAQYAINGYEVDAVDYILKPVSYYDFKMKLLRALNRASHRQRQTIPLELPGGIRQVPVSELIYVESLSHYLLYHVGGSVYRVRGNLGACEQQLGPWQFCRIHKSFLVNLAYVEEIRASELIIAGGSLPIGRTFKNDLIQSFFRYVRG